MKGNGNDIGTLFRKLRFMLTPTAWQRSQYIMRHRNLFRKVGIELQFQSRQFPSDPELISIGDNVRIASGVSFVNHDGVHAMLNLRSPEYKKTDKTEYLPKLGCIEIGDNVVIGSKTIIMPNVKIGNNVVIAAGSIVTKDIPNNVVVGGIPAKPIGTFEELVEKRKQIINQTTDELWGEFDSHHTNEKI